MEKLIIATEEQIKKIFKDTLTELLSTLPPKDSTQSFGDYIEENEAAAMLRKKTTWLYNMRASGRLPYTKVGNKTFYSRADLIKLLEDNKK